MFLLIFCEKYIITAIADHFFIRFSLIEMFLSRPLKSTKLRRLFKIMAITATYGQTIPINLVEVVNVFECKWVSTESQGRKSGVDKIGHADIAIWHVLLSCLWAELEPSTDRQTYRIAYYCPRPVRTGLGEKSTSNLKIGSQHLAQISFLYLGNHCATF
jgi:hypothetical protein